MTVLVLLPLPGVLTLRSGVESGVLAAAAARLNGDVNILELELLDA